jgi:uncharacterized protein YfbU (UPF0304 family)
VNQYKILEKLYPENEKQYAKHREILERGVEGFYEEVFEDIQPEIGPEARHFVEEVLYMFLQLQRSFKKLKDKGDLESRAVLFFGFDVRDRNEWLFMEFLKTAAHRWREQETWRGVLGRLSTDPGDDLSVRKNRYAEMLDRWKAIERRHSDNEKWELTGGEIKSIVGGDNIPE